MKLLSIILSLFIASGIAGCGNKNEYNQNISPTPSAVTQQENTETIPAPEQPSQGTFSFDEIDKYSGKPYVVVNGNVPFISVDSTAYTSYESYSALDSLGRCGVCIASVGRDIMPTEARGSIGSVKPTGWHSVKYDFVVGKYLYNRCHLLGFQLTGENANERNLITGTRSMNTQGMLPFENMVADYVKETGNHVLLRVTPHFEGNNLLASGVLMEAISVEDSGAGVMFCVYCYNAEPGVAINYENGDNCEDIDAPILTEEPTQQEAQNTYMLNTSTNKFHYPYCHSVKQMSDKNKQTYTGIRQSLINSGYSPCGNCNP